MARIPKGSGTFFRLGPAENGKAGCFAVRRGDASGVLNVIVLHCELQGDLKALTLCGYPLGTIGDMLAVVQDGLHGVRRYVAKGVPLIGVGNVTEDGVDLTEVNRITGEEHERLQASHVMRGDLLVTITGRLGTAASYDSDEPANLSAHVALCRAKAGYELLYLKHYLASRFGAASMMRAQIGSTHAHINVRRLVELPIPLPPRSLQQKLANSMEEARAARRAKLAQADQRFANLDEFVLETVGLTPPRKDERKTFAVRRADAQRQRHLNANYYHPERVLALRAMEKGTPGVSYKPLVEVVSFIREQIKTPGANYLSLANVQSNTGELVPAAEEAAGGCSTFQESDVLFARLRPYLNKVYRAESSGCCSPEFHVLRTKDSAALRPDYLAAILRSSVVMAQTRHMMTGNTHPRLTNDDVVSLVIPIPSLDVQERIAIEVRRCREEARTLRADAEAGWQAAMQGFEEQLLGNW
jgi:type I restriction enzyme, S subunit